MKFSIIYEAQMVDTSRQILFLVQMGTVPHEATMTTIRNIGQHLIPHFR